MLIKILLPLITALFLAYSPVSAKTPDPNQVLKVTVQKEGNAVIIAAIEKTQGYPTLNTDGGKQYSLQLLDNNDNSLHDVKFTFVNEITGEIHNKSGKMEGIYGTQNVDSRTITVPYKPSIQKARVLDSNGNILGQRDLSNFVNPTPPPSSKQPAKNNLPFVTAIAVASVTISAIVLSLVGFLIYRKKIKKPAATTTAILRTPSPTTISNFSISRKIIISVLILTAAAIAIATFAYFKYQKPRYSTTMPNAKPKIPTKEMVAMLNLMPIQVKGQYIFEYEPKSQFFSLDILNPDRQEEIKKEAIAIIKKATKSNDYCKFDVLVAGDPEKVKVHALPGCK